MSIYKDIRPDDPLRQLKKDANRQHEQALAEVDSWRIDHPDEWAAWFEGIKNRNQQAILDGAAQGWWDIDENGKMLAPPIIINSANLPKGAIMAHVVAAAGIFPSVSRARKNGWNKPLTKGLITVTKKKIRIKVV